MEIAEALNRIIESRNLRNVSIAAMVGVAEATVGRWRQGKSTPRAEQFMALRRAFPDFADLVDGKVVA